MKTNLYFQYNGFLLIELLVAFGIFSFMTLMLFTWSTESRIQQEEAARFKRALLAVRSVLNSKDSRHNFQNGLTISIEKNSVASPVISSFKSPPVTVLTIHAVWDGVRKERRSLCMPMYIVEQ